MEPQSSKTLLMELGRSQTQQAGKQNRAFMTALRHSFKYDSLAANADVTSDDDMAASPPADERRQTLPRELSGPMGSGKGPPKLEREEFKVQHLSRVQSRRESRRSATLTRGRLSVAWQDESEPRRSSERGGERRRPASESSGVRVLRQSLTSEFGTSAESIDLRDRRKSGSSGVSRSAAQRSGGSENCWTEESENRLSEVSEPVFKRSDRSRSGWSANSLSKESETGRIEQPENSRGKRFDSDNRRSESSVKGRSKRPGSRPSEGSENGLFREPSRTGLPVRSADSVSGSGLRTASAPGDRSADGVKLPVLVQVGRFEHTNSRKASTPLVLESVLSNIASNAHENEAEQTATAPLQTIARTGEGGFRNRAWVPEFEPLASLVQSPGAKVPRLQLPGGVVSKGDRVNESGWLEWRILAELRAKAVKDVKERAGSPEFYREVRKVSGSKELSIVT